MKFSHSFNVAIADIDEQGHVNNVAYLRWIQDVAVAHWRNSASEEQLAKYSWVTVRHEIDYKKQAFENEEITAITWIGEWKHVTCERFTEIHRGDELLAKGRTIWCMIDRETAKPARITKELIERFV
ncbi:MAG TPA: thioesterase family protein [Pyrinomonadaceae bacterium]|jgi:acyl-CoA thioester hydrolase|nr:thioesterase family protein [Pyrinomonadaceae bacterium]